MIGRYNGLKKATIIVRDDGKLDVIRERESTGESFRGCANLEEAFETIRAHGGDTVHGLRKERDIYRDALNEIASDGCTDEACLCCGFDQGNAKAALRRGLVRSPGHKST